MNSIPFNWKETLNRCNFYLARREIGEYFQMTNREAHAKGGEYVYKKEFVDGWEKFADNPSYETAKQFLEQAPEYAPMVFNYFAGCYPGGNISPNWNGDS